jgi:hypothetical protein
MYLSIKNLKLKCQKIKIVSSLTWFVMLLIRLYRTKSIVSDWETTKLVFMLHELVIDILLQQLQAYLHWNAMRSEVVVRESHQVSDLQNGKWCFDSSSKAE